MQYDWVGINGLGLMDTEKESCKMVEDWGRETERIDPIQNASVSHDQSSIVTNPPVSLDGTHGHPAQKA
jgi:hypothetical protein